MNLHAGLIALDRRGVLITGPAGAGKSDLALRALEAGFRLVADDRTVVWTSGGQLFGRAPNTLAGQIEVRGLGVVDVAAIAFAQIVLVAECGLAVERLPGPDSQEILGLRIARVRVSPLEGSAPAKLRHALIHLGERA